MQFRMRFSPLTRTLSLPLLVFPLLLALPAYANQSGGNASSPERPTADDFFQRSSVAPGQIRLADQSCEELRLFFREVASMDEYPCGPEVREHKRALLAAVARCLNKEGVTDATPMEEVLTRELSCEEPSPYVLNVLKSPWQVEHATSPPALSVLPKLLEAYHEGAFPHEWPYLAVALPREAGHSQERYGSRLGQYIREWNIQEPSLALEYFEQSMAGDNPRMLTSAFHLADRELFSAFLATTLKEPGLHLPTEKAQVTLTAISARQVQEDYRLFLEVMSDETRQAAALWLLEQIRTTNLERASLDNQIEEKVQEYTGPLSESEYRGYLRDQTNTWTQMIPASLTFVHLLINGAEISEEELAEVDRDPAMARELAFRADPELREAIEQASNSAASPQVRRHFSELVELINQAEQR